MTVWDELFDLKREIQVVEEMCREQLDGLYSRRAFLVRQALADGHSQAKVADFLGITHSAVQKIRRRPLTDTST